MNGLLIGRFQPFHLGHLEAIMFGLSKVENLWIGIGSSNKSNEMKNPFTADERKEMILSSIDKNIAERIKIYYIPDVADHSKWTQEIDLIIPKYDVVFSNDEFTQHLFQKRDVKVVPVTLKQRESFSGTNIREKIANDKGWENLVPDGTRNVLLKINAKDRLQVFNYK
jgi:nicotinamide-nucleotide adenylyltransferase